MRVVLEMPKNLITSLITLLWNQTENNRLQGKNLFEMQILLHFKKSAKLEKKIRNP